MTTAAATAPALFPPLALHPVRIADDVADAPATVLAVPLVSGPRSRHHTYRGTRGLAFVFLGIAGLGVMALGSLATQVAETYGGVPLSASDAHLLGVLLRVAPFVMLLGFAQLLATWGVVRDKPRAMATGMVFALGGAAAALAGAVAVAGNGGALASAMPAGPSTDLLSTFAWIAALDLLAALSIRRIIRGRSTF
jgi:hypothetical protein